MPPRALLPSEYVGRNVRSLREKRGWTQHELAERLAQLLTARPRWVDDLSEDDPRRPIPGSKEMPSKWDQPKIHRLEAGKRQRVTVDDVFELAAALDVSPLYLLTPLETFDENENAIQVRIGNKLVRWPRAVREWIRGERPLLGLGDYRTNEGAKAGARFFFFEGRPMRDWQFPDANPEVAQLMRDAQAADEEEE